MKYCTCDRWKKESRLDHHDESGKSSYKNTFTWCPFCRRKLKWPK